MINQSLFNLCYVITNTTWICQPPMFAYICFLRYHLLTTLKEQWPQSYGFSIQKEYDLILHASNLLKNHKSHNNIFSVHEFYSAFLDYIWLVNFYHIFHIGEKFLYEHSWNMDISRMYCKIPFRSFFIVTFTTLASLTTVMGDINMFLWNRYECRLKITFVARILYPSDFFFAITFLIIVVKPSSLGSS